METINHSSTRHVKYVTTELYSIVYWHLDDLAVTDVPTYLQTVGWAALQQLVETVAHATDLETAPLQWVLNKARC